jgi:hypothetical protein
MTSNQREAIIILHSVVVAILFCFVAVGLSVGFTYVLIKTNETKPPLILNGTQTHATFIGKI